MSESAKLTKKKSLTITLHPQHIITFTTSTNVRMNKFETTNRIKLAKSWISKTLKENHKFHILKNKNHKKMTDDCSSPHQSCLCRKLPSLFFLPPTIATNCYCHIATRPQPTSSPLDPWTPYLRTNTYQAPLLGLKAFTTTSKLGGLCYDEGWGVKKGKWVRVQGGRYF